MASFRHEDVAQTPPGWRVRTVTRGEHRIRIAVPPGPRQAGAGRTVQILHPAGERNPCGVRYLLPNPSELLILGANPHRPARPNPTVIGSRIARMRARGASGAEVGRMLSKATANPHRRGRRGTGKNAVWVVYSRRGSRGAWRRTQTGYPSREAAEQQAIRMKGMGYDTFVRGPGQSGAEFPSREFYPPENMPAPMRGVMENPSAKRNPHRRNPWRVISITPELFDAEIQRRLRKGYASDFSEYMRKQPDALAIVDDAGRLQKVGSRSELDAWMRRYQENPHRRGRGGRSRKGETAAQAYNRKMDEIFDRAAKSKKVNPVTLTRELAWAASQDAANRSMRKGGRTAWSEEDANVQARTFNKLWPVARDLEMQRRGQSLRVNPQGAAHFQVKLGTTKDRVPHYKSRIRWAAPLPEIYQTREAATKAGQRIAGARTHTAFDVVRATRRNPSAASVESAEELYETFHGRPAKELLELEEPERRGVVLTGLGELIALTIDPAGAKNGNHSHIALDFTGEGIKLASNAAGSQLYLVGGNQALTSEQLARFGTDTSKEFVELGEVRGQYKNWRHTKQAGELGDDDAASITYRSAKSFTGHKPSNYWHEFAEEGGKPPIAFYDRTRKRIVLMGGNYRVEAPGIIN